MQTRRSFLQSAAAIVPLALVPWKAKAARAKAVTALHRVDPACGTIAVYERWSKVPKRIFTDKGLTKPACNPHILGHDGSFPTLYWDGDAEVVLTNDYTMRKWGKDPVMESVDFYGQGVRDYWEFET